MERIIVFLALLLLTGCGARKKTTESKLHIRTEATREVAKELISWKTARGTIAELRLALSPPDSSGAQAIESISQIKTVFTVEDTTRAETIMHFHSGTEKEETGKQTGEIALPFNLPFNMPVILIVIVIVIAVGLFLYLKIHT